MLRRQHSFTLVAIWTVKTLLGNSRDVSPNVKRELSSVLSIQYLKTSVFFLIHVYEYAFVCILVYGGANTHL